MTDRDLSDFDEVKDDHPTGASNVLVLAPLTPAGTEAYHDLLSSMIDSSANLAVVTYNQPPAMWVINWIESDLPFPEELTFIHGGPEPGAETLSEVDSAISKSK